MAFGDSDNNMWNLGADRSCVTLNELLSNSESYLSDM